MSRLCDICAKIDLRTISTTGPPKSQLSKYNDGTLIARLRPNIGHEPTERCSLCSFFYQARQDSDNENQSFELRAYSYMEISPFIRYFAAQAYWEHDIPFLAVVPTGSNSAVVKESCARRGGIFIANQSRVEPCLFSPQIMSEEVDFRLARLWLDYCVNHHPKTCVTRVRQVSGLKLIDCASRSVVSAPPDAMYVALSYVWGSSKKLSENSHKFSKTVRDALIVTRKLNLDYLWVDKHCIDQGNAVVMHQQVSNMDVIYKGAYVTIVASAGEDADHGLPGVNDTPRERQPVAAIGEYTLVNTMTPPHEAISKSKWVRRGWTLQEEAMSSRRLYFTENQLYYECGTMNCCEALAPDLKRIHNAKGQRHRFLDNGILDGRANRALYRYGEKYQYKRCRSLVTEYTRRQLSYDSDAYTAFLGIMRHFSEYHVRDIWGIPFEEANDNDRDNLRQTFTESLIWYHRHDCVPKPSRRVPTQDTGTPSPPDFTLSFPSYSWVGWHGPVAYDDRSSKMVSSISQVRIELRDGRMVDVIPPREPPQDVKAAYDESMLSMPSAMHVRTGVWYNPGLVYIDTDPAKPEIRYKGHVLRWRLSTWPEPTEKGNSVKALYDKIREKKIKLLYMAWREYSSELCFLVIEKQGDSWCRIGIMRIWQVQKWLTRYLIDHKFKKRTVRLL